MVYTNHGDARTAIETLQTNVADLQADVTAAQSDITDLLAGGGGGGGGGPQTLENAVAGSRFDVFYDPVTYPSTGWPATRPSARTDIHFTAVGGGVAVADPTWAIVGDKREIVM